MSVSKPVTRLQAAFNEAPCRALEPVTSLQNLREHFLCTVKGGLSIYTPRGDGCGAGLVQLFIC